MTDHYSNKNGHGYHEHLQKLLCTEQQIPSSHGGQTTKTDTAADQQDDGGNEHNRARSSGLPGPEIGDDHCNDGADQIAQVAVEQCTPGQNPEVSNAANQSGP